MKKIAFLLLTLVSFQLSYAQKTDSTHRVDFHTHQHFSFKQNGFRFNQLITPTAILATRLALNGNNPESWKNEIVEERNKLIPNFKTRVGTYLQFSPIVIAYGLDAFGIKSKTDIANRTAILAKGELCMMGVVTLLKYTTHIQRPDHTSYNSFPSGHTAQAFAAASFLSEEYKDRFKWMPYAAYGIASVVGGLRIANNRHYISDVLVGAAIGILSMKLAYWTHQYKWGKHRR